MVERSGTFGYIAPEVKKNNMMIGPEVDMWAFGVILYELCTAYKPTAVKKYQYGTGPIPFVARDWRKLDKKGAPIQDLILKCLELEPEKRITSEQALESPWFDNL